MMKKIKNIKVIVWDVDGTLYRSTPELSRLVKRKEVELLRRVKEISLAAAARLFDEKKKIHKSGTMALVKLGCGDIAFVGRKTEVLNRGKFIKKDPKLLEVFKKLFQFRHIAVRNGTLKETVKTLHALGLGAVFRINTINDTKSNDRSSLCHGDSLDRRYGYPLGPFERIFSTVDHFRTVKPDPVVFKKILEYTKLPANQHLIVGDRFEVDLVPAKKLGMKTCLVWSQSDDPSVDISIKRVYDIVKILI